MTERFGLLREIPGRDDRSLDLPEGCRGVDGVQQRKPGQLSWVNCPETFHVTGLTKNGIVVLRMSRNPSMTFLAWRAVFVLGLLCTLIFTQAGFSQLPSEPCGVNASISSEGRASAPGVDCHQCCAAMPCCLTSKPASDTPSRPEPLSNEQGQQLDHAPVVATLTLVPTFDLFASPQKSRLLAGNRQFQPARQCAPRGAVSCIWLI